MTAVALCWLGFNVGVGALLTRGYLRVRMRERDHAEALVLDRWRSDAILRHRIQTMQEANARFFADLQATVEVSEHGVFIRATSEAAAADALYNLCCYPVRAA